MAAAGHGTEDDTVVLPEEYAEELVMMGLRLDRGLSAPRFAALTGRPLTDALDPDGLKLLSDEGLVAWHGDYLRATPAGMPLLNGIIARLLT